MDDGDISYPSWQERFQRITGTHPDALGIKDEAAGQSYLMRRAQQTSQPTAPRKQNPIREIFSSPSKSSIGQDFGDIYPPLRK